MSDISEEVKNAAVAAPVAIIVGGKLKKLHISLDPAFCIV